MEKDKDIKSKVIDLLDWAKPKKKQPRKPTKKSGKSVTMNVTGNGNIQAGHDVLINTKPPVQNILPPPTSIGADPLLKQRIKTLFNKIGEARGTRYGNNAYGVMYKNFKRDFMIKNNKWEIIWTWPKECASAILDYLEDKYAITIPGKIEKAASKPGYIHTRPYLYKREKELLEQLGYTMKSQEIRNLLRLSFGVSSHTELSHNDHWRLVSYLEGLAKQLEN
ncbi:MAG: hypothetical protein PVG39_26080 [Desulfobacteraceae bacterium]|jgi:hypothetical protein